MVKPWPNIMWNGVAHQSVRTKEPLANVSKLKLCYTDLPSAIKYTLAAECARYDLVTKADT